MLNQNMSSLFKDCKEDCNGGQGKISVDGGEYQVESVRLFPFLSEHYSSSFIKNICMVKIDTEVCNLCSTGSPKFCNTTPDDKKKRYDFEMAKSLSNL